MKGQRLLMKVLLMLMVGVSLVLGACGKKLPPPDPKNPIHILTRQGLGYYMPSEEAPAPPG